MHWFSIIQQSLLQLNLRRVQSARWQKSLPLTHLLNTTSIPKLLNTILSYKKMGEWQFLTLGLLVKQSFRNLKDLLKICVFLIQHRTKSDWSGRIWFEWFNNIKTSKSSKERIRLSSKKKYCWWGNSKKCFTRPYLLCGLNYRMIVCWKFIYPVYCVVMTLLLSQQNGHLLRAY